MSTPGKRNSSGTRDNDRSAQVCLEKPKLELNRSVDKTEEEEKVKLLLRDDFVDDGEPINFDNGPVILPMIKGFYYLLDISNYFLKNHILLIFTYYRKVIQRRH